MPEVKGCLLVGSVPFPDAATVFKDASTAMPHRLKRIPDGETGHRHYFTLFQGALFSVYPPMMAKFMDNGIADSDEFTPEQVEEGLAKLKEKPLETGYDTAASESYAVFKKLRDEGVIEKGVKFQVCLPTAASVVGPFLQQAFRAPVWPIYEEALSRAIVKIQENIPHEDLAIQFDLAGDTAYWEGVYMQPWFENPKEFTVAHITKLLKLVASDVEVGLHNCYGDMDHKHWYEPKSLQAVNDRGLIILESGAHKIDWFHCPVPVSASDFLDDFVKPIVPFYEKLKAQGGELYLGVVQYNDLEGTKKRIEAAGKHIPEFGIATECGMGRTPKDQIADLFKLSTEVSEPVSV